MRDVYGDKGTFLRHRTDVRTVVRETSHRMVSTNSAVALVVAFQGTSATPNAYGHG